MYSTSGRLTLKTLSMSASLLLLLTGCGEAIHNTAEDDDFIRESGAAQTATPELKSGPLLPTKVGSTWKNRVVTRRIYGSSTGSQDPNVDDEGNPFPVVYERTVARREGTGLILDARAGEQGNSSHAELYEISKSGASLSRISGDQSMATIPPVPLFSTPVHPGEIKKWTGWVQLGNKKYPAQAYSRCRAPEEINTEQKTVAYRVDTVITANIDGRQSVYSMSRWFTPSIGIVRQRYFVNNLEKTKELVAYKP